MRSALTILVILSIFSCSNEPPFHIGGKVLSIIKQTRTAFDKDGRQIALQFSHYYITNGQLSKVIAANNYEIFEYTGTRVSRRLKYSLSDQLISTTTHTYDDLGRLVGIVYSDGQNTVSNETHYVGNKVISVWNNAWGHFSYERYVMTLNDAGQITREEVWLNNDSLLEKGIYHYTENNNLDHGEINGPENDSLFFSYYPLENKQALNKLVFGEKWRMNSSIVHAVNFLTVGPNLLDNLLSVYPDISDNLISVYKSKRLRIVYSYTFDSSGNITSRKETRYFLDGYHDEIVTEYAYVAKLQ